MITIGDKHIMMQRCIVRVISWGVYMISKRKKLALRRMGNCSVRHCPLLAFSLFPPPSVFPTTSLPAPQDQQLTRIYDVGIAFEEVTGRLFPVVGLGQGTQIKANFGKTPYKYRDYKEKENLERRRTTGITRRRTHKDLSESAPRTPI
jgi:hypothetical protein